MACGMKDASRQHPPRTSHPALPLREQGARHAGGARQRRRGHLVEPDDAHHLLDQVGGPMDVGPPAGRGHLDRVTLALDGEAQRLQRGADLALLEPDAGEPLDEARPEADDGLGLRRCAGDFAPRRRAACGLHHHGGGEIEPGEDERGVDAALEAIARIADDAGLAASGGGAQRVEIGAFDQHVLGRFSAAGTLAAEDAAEAEHGAIVGDHAHGVVGLVLAAVEAVELLSLSAEPRADGADELVGVVDVQGAAAVE
jgi:hypothetical protein